jgi:hypothetical protein
MTFISRDNNKYFWLIFKNRENYYGVSLLSFESECLCVNVYIY